jgi:signal transduction histidine kinase
MPLRGGFRRPPTTGSPSGAGDTADRAGEVRLSRRLVGLHLGGVLLLILVVLSTVGWISAEHNRLAVKSSESMVEGGVNSFRSRLRTLVRDYSIWDEAYAAAVAGDREWLYSNIGSAAAEIGTLDLIVFVNPVSGEPFGWQHSSPREGETGLLPADLLARLLAVLDEEESDTQPPTILAEREGTPWVFSAARVIPVEGPPADVPADLLPVQVHGLALSGSRLERIGHGLLIEDLRLADEPAPGDARVPLIDYDGRTIAYIAWRPPHPGASILRRVAVPLGLALAFVSIVSGISSYYAVRSARRLESALQAARAADQSKTEFLSNVSHELRTPMNGILGVAQLLQTTELDAEQKELVAVLFSSANAQMALISDLLDFSRIESGNRHLVQEPFEPGDVLKDLGEMIRVAASKRGISYSADCRALDGLTVSGDERAFRQIVTNLLGNAVKFTDHGGVELRVRAVCDDDVARVQVSVTDTGRGIPAEALPHVFDRFYQADSSLTRATEGTGLGLAISQNLAHLMGGGIDVQSEPGVGSTFTLDIRFPVVGTAGPIRDAA